jgi:hypothetical protein
MEYRYRTVSRTEEHNDERYFADRVVEIFSKKLGLRNVQLRFIEEDPYGEHVFSAPIAGFCPRGNLIGEMIYICRGRDSCDTVKTMLHELRHGWQRQTGACQGRASMERDARLYVLELNPPTRKEKLYRWLAEQMLDEPAPRRPEIRANKMVESIPERIAYIRGLLNRLPSTPAYKSQRAALMTELNERLAQL